LRYYTRYEILIRGLVQGVGFRPFICRLAAKYGLSGEVDNRTDGVSVILQGDLKTMISSAMIFLKMLLPLLI